MRQTKLMPECFEKTLVRIIYMLSLLSRDDSVDDILFIDTTVLRVAQLHSDLAIVHS